MTHAPCPNPHAVRADVLGNLEIVADSAAIQARIHRLHATPDDLYRAAHHDLVVKVTNGLHTLASRGLIEHLAAFTDDDDSYQTAYGEALYAWHTIRLYRGPRLFDPGEGDQAAESHPPQCSTLPPGAVCWFTHNPHHDWWPAWHLHGTYRLRPVFYLVGRGDGDPDVDESFDIQVLDEATGTWSDWHGTTVGETAEVAGAAHTDGAAL